MSLGLREINSRDGINLPYYFLEDVLLLFYRKYYVHTLMHHVRTIVKLGTFLQAIRSAASGVKQPAGASAWYAC